LLPYCTLDYISEYLGYKATGPRMGHRGRAFEKASAGRLREKHRFLGRIRYSSNWVRHLTLKEG
jgi:hypothetical protein